MKHVYCRSLAALLVALLMVLLTSPAYAQTTVSLEEYETVLREALAAAQRNDEIGLREAATRLGTITTVKADDGTLLPVKNDWLNTALDGNQPNLRSIRGRLGAQVEAITAAHSNGPEALTKLQEILSKSPYAEQAPPSPSSSRPSFFGNMFDFFDGVGELITGCLTILAILVVAGVVYYIGMAVRTGMRREVVHSRRKLDDEVLAENLNSAKAMDRASEVAVEGDFRKAVRYLYISTLLWLDERGAVRYDRTLTNREVLEAVPTGSPLRARLAPVVGTFDHVWYGYQDIDQAAFDTFRQQVTALREGR